jgi:uncharacterized damage-inducible protein DinB
MVGTEYDMSDVVTEVWRTSNRVLVYFVENLPDDLWAAKVPGAPRRTVRMIVGHIHNCRCMWIKMIGGKHGLAVPESVNRHKATRRQVIRALGRSGKGVEKLLRFGLTHPKKFTAFPLDASHFMSYLVAHEGHHRGQICMIARQLGQRLPDEVTVGLWQWSKRAKEV